MATARSSGQGGRPTGATTRSSTSGCAASPSVWRSTNTPKLRRVASGNSVERVRTRSIAACSAGRLRALTFGQVTPLLHPRRRPGASYEATLAGVARHCVHFPTRASASRIGEQQIAALRSASRRSAQRPSTVTHSPALPRHTIDHAFAGERHQPARSTPVGQFHLAVARPASVRARTSALRTGSCDPRSTSPAIGQRHERIGIGDREPGVEVQFAVAAIIVEAIGQVDVLLDLDHRDAAADRVDRAGGRIDEVARP